ncbi:MAG: endonuclease/exonuclease/phosphatase, partial [Microcystis sp.]
MIDRFYKRLTAENFRFPILGLIASLIVTFSLAACGVSPQVLAEQRMFLPLSIEFLGEYQLPQADYQGTRVGGL